MKIILGYISYYTIVFYSISLNDLLNYNDFKFGSRNSVFSITIGLIIVITIFDIEFFKHFIFGRFVSIHSSMSCDICGLKQTSDTTFKIRCRYKWI